MQKVQIYNVFIVLVLFLYVFGISFTFVPVNSTKIVVAFLLVCFALNKLLSNEVYLKKEFVKIFLFIFCMAVISAGYAVFHQTNDFSVAYHYIVMLVEGLVGAYLVLWFIEKAHTSISFETMLKYIVAISIIQALVILLMLSNETFRNIIFGVLNTTSLALFERYGGFRGLGLAGSVTYDLAVFLSISLMFIAYLIKVQKRNILLYVFSFVLILSAMFITGRTGIVGLACAILIMLIGMQYKQVLRQNIKTFIYVLLFIALFFYVIITSEFAVLFIEKLAPYALELFVNVVETGQLSTTSSDNVINMYFPISEQTFFYGDGHWKSAISDTGYYMGTDVGYMRHILFYGIVPCLLLYAFHAYYFVMIGVKLRKRHKYAGILILMIGCYYFLVHFKGAFIAGSAMNVKLFFLLLVQALFFEKKRYQV